jgi:hypothetical protein
MPKAEGNHSLPGKPEHWKPSAGETGKACFPDEER